MTSFDAVRIAAVQATPVVPDAEATIAQALDLVAHAVEDGSQFVVLPECFVSRYPSGTWAAAAATWTRSA